MKIAEFFLDEDKLDTGVRLLLEDRNGKPLDEWIQILFIHSDEAQSRMARAMRADFEAGLLNLEDGRSEDDLTRRYAWTLVHSWSFEEECTEDNVKELLHRAPDIRNSIVAKAEKKRLFFPPAAGSSSTGRKKKRS